MSWTCHGTTNAGMVAALKRAGLIRTNRVEEAMAAVDRGLFVPPLQLAQAYQDAPMPIGHAATISAPHMHASCLELLADHLQPGAKVLDVGSGSGYLTAVMARLVRDGQGARVVGVDHIAELVAASRNSTSQIPWADALMKADMMRLLTADGQLGYPQWAPYNVIHVGAAAPQVPQALIDQLAPGGRMVIPVGPEGQAQQLYVVDKDPQGRVSSHVEMGVVYVPLTSERHQRAKVPAGAGV